MEHHSSPLIKDLDNLINQCKSNAFAPSTSRTYLTQRNSYLRFCQLINIPPVPATSRNICRYAVYLSKSKKYNTIKQYLNIIRLIHLECNLPNPLLNDFQLEMVLRGLKRSLGTQVLRKIPITVNHLYIIKNKIDFSSTLHVVYWAAALLMFFTLLRRSNVLAPSGGHAPGHYLKRKDISIHDKGASLTIRSSKTIQFRDRVLIFPLPRLRTHPLCPTRAVYGALKAVNASPDSPAFMLSSSTPLSPETFIKLTRQFLSDSVSDPSLIGGHSFRRGGASFCFQNNFNTELIRILGDWVSDSYKDYILPSEALLASASAQFAEAIKKFPFS